jgi:hypothetical protein
MFFYGVQAEDEETVDNLKITNETDCFLCEVQTDARGTAVNLNI